MFPGGLGASSRIDFATFGFAYQMLVLPLAGQPLLITREMERVTVRDQVSEVRHVGYSDGAAPLPPPQNDRADLTMSALSWLLRTGRGDSFLSDTVVVTERGPEVLTTVSRDFIVR